METNIRARDFSPPPPPPQRNSSRTFIMEMHHCIGYLEPHWRCIFFRYFGVIGLGYKGWRASPRNSQVGYKSSIHHQSPWLEIGLHSLQLGTHPFSVYSLELPWKPSKANESPRTMQTSMTKIFLIDGFSRFTQLKRKVSGYFVSFHVIAMLFQHNITCLMLILPIWREWQRKEKKNRPNGCWKLYLARKNIKP